ncbi:regulator of G-protein signaling 7-binding protein A-like isoform X1 [Branchiostoma lanceolatum]|uniref:regulator of G-protein signaling 7-binding protein A-like isoform X1 n=1 Tax=Branchiostoma lanceolatum TaxID=7740 RepID=UPI003456BEBA
MSTAPNVLALRFGRKNSVQPQATSPAFEPRDSPEPLTSKKTKELHEFNVQIAVYRDLLTHIGGRRDTPGLRTEIRKTRYKCMELSCALKLRVEPLTQTLNADQMEELQTRVHNVCCALELFIRELQKSYRLTSAFEPREKRRKSRSASKPDDPGADRWSQASWASQLSSALARRASQVSVVGRHRLSQASIGNTLQTNGCSVGGSPQEAPGELHPWMPSMERKKHGKLEELAAILGDIVSSQSTLCELYEVIPAAQETAEDQLEEKRRKMPRCFSLGMCCFRPAIVI